MRFLDWSTNDMALYENRLKQIHDEAARLEYGFEQGIREGRQMALKMLAAGSDLDVGSDMELCPPHC